MGMARSIAPDHLRFAVLAVDVALFTVRDGELLVRLVHVVRPPYFPDNTALPGGIIDPKETAEDAARRQLSEKAHINPEHVYIEQLATFSDINRDRRGRVVSVAYLALVPWEKLSVLESQNTTETWWSPLKDARKLAYDHDDMLKVAITRLKSRVTYTTLIRALMPQEFTLTELEHMYESILGTELDKRNFRKKILKLNILTELPKKRTGGKFRPAQLYRFESKKVENIEVI